MSERNKINYLTASGFKSIKHLDRLALRDINVLIGANGAGKSNLVSFFGMLNEIVAGRLQAWTRKQGSADRVVSFGVKETESIKTTIEATGFSYSFALEVSNQGDFYFAEESFHLDGTGEFDVRSHGSGQQESLIYAFNNNRFSLQLRMGDDTIECNSMDELPPEFGTVFRASSAVVSGIKCFHFHDTSETAKVKRSCAVHDSQYLRADASNLAAYLFALKSRDRQSYDQILQTIRLAIPFFDDFDFRPQPVGSGEEQISLLWNQCDNDYPFWPSQLSDGSLRFICLATALLQPEPPSTIIIDEPELGLHPYAIALLGGLIRSASKRMQVIVATQSIPLVNEFSIEDLIVVEREDGASVFRRLQQDDFREWLEDYSVGELWDKNVLGGRPPR